MAPDEPSRRIPRLRAAAWLWAAAALAGAAFAWAALRLGGLEFAIGAHVATNLMIAFFQAPMLPDDPEVTGGLDETLIEVLLAFYMVAVVELVRRSDADREAA